MPKNIPLGDHNLENVEAYWNAAKSPDPKAKFINKIGTINETFIEARSVIEATTSPDQLLMEEKKPDDNHQYFEPSSILETTKELVVPGLSINGGSIHALEIDLGKNESIGLEEEVINDYVNCTIDASMDELTSYAQLSFTNIDVMEVCARPEIESMKPFSTLQSSYDTKLDKISAVDIPLELEAIGDSQNEILINEELVVECEVPVALSSTTNSDSNENHYEDITEEPKQYNIRRSNRRRYKPLAFWKNERVIYGRRESCAKLSLPAVLDIITYPEIENSKVISRRLGTKKRRMARAITLPSSSRKGLRKPKMFSLTHRLERLGFEEHKEVSGPVLAIDSDNQKQEISQSRFFYFHDIVLMISHSNVESSSSLREDDFMVAPTFTKEGSFSSGSLILPPKFGKKPNSNSGPMSIVCLRSLILDLLPLFRHM